MTDEATLFAQIDVVAANYLSAGKPLPVDNYLYDDLIEVGGVWAEVSAADAYQLLLNWRRKHHPGTSPR